MINKNTYHSFALIVLCGIVWMACTQQRSPCLTPKIASLNVECMHKLTDTGTVFVDTAIPAVYWIAITDSGPHYFSYLVQNADFTLSLSSISDTCKWGVTADTALSPTGALLATRVDTLTFFYRRQLQFLSNACGFAYFYTLDSVHTTHYSTTSTEFMIDSVHIENSSVTNDINTKQLQIYIHPDF